MGSADFRIIPHRVLEAAKPGVEDLVRYVIAYVSSSQPRYLMLDDHSQPSLVTDEKMATRFPTSDAAHQRLQQLIERRELLEVDNSVE